MARYTFYQDASGEKLIIKANSSKEAWSKLTKKYGKYVANSFELLKSPKMKKSKSKTPVNTQTNTARSKKQYKLVLVKSKTNIVKKYTNSTKEINTFITNGRKSFSRLKWYLYTYRPSLKAYRISRKSSNA